MPFKANILIFFLPIALIFTSCNSAEIEEDADDDYLKTDSIQQVKLLEDGTLNVLMSNNIASYYIFKGQPRGFEYEMLKLFCKDNGLHLKINVIRDFDYLLDSLQAGKGDIAAGNITITKDRRAYLDFSPEVLRTRQVLVQQLPEGYKKLSKKQRKARLIQDALDLNGKTVYVNTGSAFYARLQNYAAENGIDLTIKTVPSELGTDELVEMVAKGEIEYTVMDENVAKIHASIYKNLDISVPVSLSQSIAWAIPKGNLHLKKLLESWIAERKKSTRFNMIYNKYFGSRGHLHNPKNYLVVKGGIISPYDDILKKHAVYIDWDWLLLASLVNKESKFNPSAKSSFGAVGLMQVLPNTGKRFGIDSTMLLMPEPNVIAGTRFLQWLDQFWYKRIEDTTQIIYFVLASYNAGPGHVLDAMYLAEKYGLNPQVWKDNVEVMLEKKSQPKYYKDPVAKRGYCNGKQPVDYVEKVMRYYAFYKAYYDKKPAQKSLALN